MTFNISWAIFKPASATGTGIWETRREKPGSRIPGGEPEIRREGSVRQREAAGNCDVAADSCGRKETMNFKITKFAITAMAVLCAGMCLAGPKLTVFVMQRPSPVTEGMIRYVMILGIGYLLAALAFFCLGSLYRLIGRIERDEIFVGENVKSLHTIAREVGAAAILSLILGIFCTVLMLAVAVMAAFMTLIIRVIRHSFEKAVSMKDELDLTI